MARADGTYPDRLTIVFTPNGLAMSLSSVVVFGGREYPGDPLPLTGEGLTALNDPALTALAESFAAEIAAERDALAAERDEAVAAKTAAETERDALQAQLDAITNPPDGIFPYQFQRLLTDAQLVAIQLSADPTLIRMRTDVQTIVSPMPFGDGSNLRNGVMYLGMILPELFPQSEVDRILARQAPE